jgi:hypothetical protein
VKDEKSFIPVHLHGRNNLSIPAGKLQSVQPNPGKGLAGAIRNPDSTSANLFALIHGKPITGWAERGNFTAHYIATPSAFPHFPATLRPYAT